MRTFARVICIGIALTLVAGCGNGEKEPPGGTRDAQQDADAAPTTDLRADGHQEQAAGDAEQHDADRASTLDLLPGEGALEGWSLVEPGTLYAGEALYDPIDGAADKYFQFRFVEAAFATYEKGDGAVELQVYKMGSPDDAAGICSTYDDPNAEHATLGETGVGIASDLNLDFAKGPYFIRVLSQGAPVAHDELLAFGRACADAIGEPFHTPAVLGLLPDGHVAGAVKHFRTAATLDDVFYITDENVLGLSEKTFGVSACYDAKTSDAGTRVGTNALFVITYAADHDAESAFAAAIKHYSAAPYRIYGVPEGPGAQLTILKGDRDFLRIARQGNLLYGAWLIEDTARADELFRQLAQRAGQHTAGGGAQ